MHAATSLSHRAGRILLLTLGGLLVGCAPRSGVQAPVPVQGDLVRVTNGSIREVYEFRELRGDVLVVERGDYRLSIPLASVDELEGVVGHRSRGSNALRGAAWGLAVGAASGAVAGLAGAPNCAQVQSFCLTSAESAAVGAMVVGGVGATLGLISGAASSTAVWAPVESSALEVQANASPAGFGLQLSWRP